VEEEAEEELVGQSRCDEAGQSRCNQGADTEEQIQAGGIRLVLKVLEGEEEE
jgi:hypothetical protein